MILPNLKDVRQQYSIKQEVVALSMNITKSTVSKLESKRTADLSLKKLTEYIAALGGKVSVEVTLPDGITYKVD